MRFIEFEVRQLISKIFCLTSKPHALSAKSVCLLHPTAFWITWVRSIEPVGLHMCRGWEVILSGVDSQRERLKVNSGKSHLIPSTPLCHVSTSPGWTLNAHNSVYFPAKVSLEASDGSEKCYLPVNYCDNMGPAECKDSCRWPSTSDTLSNPSLCFQPICQSTMPMPNSRFWGEGVSGVENDFPAMPAFHKGHHASLDLDSWGGNGVGRTWSRGGVFEKKCCLKSSVFVSSLIVSQSSLWTGVTWFQDLEII